MDVKTIDAAKPRASAYRLSDGGGLLLEVKSSGAKIWLCRLTIARKRRDMGLGGYPAVSLRDARAKARAARELAQAGTDPIAEREAAERRAAAEREAASTAQARTFKAVADLYIAAQVPGWKGTRTAKTWRNSLAGHAHPRLGKKPVDEIDRAAVLDAIGPVWASRPATARKVLRRIGSVLRYAAAHGWRLNDNPADPRMLRHLGLPALPGGRKYPSLPWAKVPAFVAALHAREGLGSLALEFTILTGVRSGESRGAWWSEVMLDGVPTWTIPGERMKGKKASDVQPHRVPLSPAAISALLRAYNLANGASATLADLPRLAQLAGASLIFPSAKRTKPLSDMALSEVVRRMNAERSEEAPAPWRDADGRAAVPHGFRSSFRTWVDDTRPADAEAAERALAHEEPNKVSGAYRRSDLFDRRIPLMADWGAYCTSAPTATVTRITGAAPN
ncbi:integrase arm-type DNA-binding domain-containing protein [Roseomonas hellenica]|uniref:Integrase arm-type DNA-binding domain-containing protein n=1 Tax=Plastoroseomonas hellenica TaxID=2687306 RepID=A0ABS5F6T8_9PROT|nr:site-specific integrase [Plastoroseomonas hellenica]MBR0668287.1 integrase arm-type DNA-binding domain-containing protein [Plastoroseomonas hellenica]